MQVLYGLEGTLCYDRRFTAGIAINVLPAGLRASWRLHHLTKPCIHTHACCNLRCRLQASNGLGTVAGRLDAPDVKTFGVFNSLGAILVCDRIGNPMTGCVNLVFQRPHGCLAGCLPLGSCIVVVAPTNRFCRRVLAEGISAARCRHKIIVPPCASPGPCQASSATRALMEAGWRW
jgi:hypothetical protein